jgi:hypothetical protein
VLLLPAPTATSRAKLTSKLATANTEKYDKKLAVSTMPKVRQEGWHTAVSCFRLSRH